MLKLIRRRQPMPKLFDGGNQGLTPVEGDSRCLSLLKATADV